MASSAAAASAGSSMIAKYISKVRAGLRRQRPEAREAWLEAEMDSMQIGSSHQGKPSLRDVCRYLNLAVSEKQKWLNKQTLVKNLVEKLMSEAAHVVESASASSGSSGLSAKYMSQVRAELRRQPPETREAWLKGEMDSMNLKSSHLGKPSVKDVCKYLNLTVSDNKQDLMKNLVEKLIGEIRHVVESASASSGSSGVTPAVVKRYVQVLRVGLTQKEPEERRSWLLKELDALLRRIMKDGKPSVEDVCRFLDLQIGDRGGGGLSLDAMKSNIMDKLIRDLPDSNAAASAPGISFVVALFCF